ncbi:MAG: hypothetical protein IBJ10_06065 [Phycisphaerales bacterium]|nr:hypothetical protein [Phycisphaerales bacterium]
MPRRPDEHYIDPIPVSRRSGFDFGSLLYLAALLFEWPVFGTLAWWSVFGFGLRTLPFAMLVGGGIGVVVGIVLLPLTIFCCERRRPSTVLLGVMAPTALAAAGSGLFALAVGVATGWQGALWVVYVGVTAVYVVTCLLVRRLGKDPRRGACPTCGYLIAGLADTTCPECGEEFVFAGQRIQLPRTTCVACGYPLEGLVNGLCPECGEPLPTTMRHAP